MPLVIRSSTIHAAGCYTTQPIPKGSFITEYTGPRLTVDDADERYVDQEETYLFGLSDGKYVIDGYGEAAFINHSCEPNCEAVESADGHIWIVALRDIAAHEELTYDYSLYDGTEEDQSRCACGALNCRGTLYSQEELARRAEARASAES
jgi:SET domain-containing protein